MRQSLRRSYLYPEGRHPVGDDLLSVGHDLEDRATRKRLKRFPRFGS